MITARLSQRIHGLLFAVMILRLTYLYRSASEPLTTYLEYKRSLQLDAPALGDLLQVDQRRQRHHAAELLAA